MKVIILAAGYGTRMYPLTKNCPKALLNINGITVLDELIKKIEKISPKEVIIVTNNKFFDIFDKWKSKKISSLNIKILNNGTNNEKEALGWTKDLVFSLKDWDCNSDFLVLASDNLFDFSLKEMISNFKNCPIIVVGNAKNKDVAKKYGIVEIENGKVISFEEKPKKPRSLKKSILCYYFPARFSGIIKHFEETNSKKHLIEWILDNKFEIHSHLFLEKCIDIGDMEQYKLINPASI